jgi:hypothetical protein
MSQRFRLLGEAVTPQQIADALNLRRQELGLRMADLDATLGFAGGYASKIFAPNYKKNLGMHSLPAMLSAMGCKLAIVLDEEAELPRIVQRTIKERTYGAGVVGHRKSAQIIE